jgi:hypothetical protein
MAVDLPPLLTIELSARRRQALSQIPQGLEMADFVEKVGARIGCNSNGTLFAEVRTA